MPGKSAKQFVPSRITRRSKNDPKARRKHSPDFSESKPMPIEITMPRLSDTMESGTVIKWTVNEGDEVSSGQAVADIETDKATMEMQVYDDGKLAKILVNEGEQVDVGTVIAILAEEDEDVSEVASSAASSQSSGSSEPKSEQADEAPSESASAEAADAQPAKTSTTTEPKPTRQPVAATSNGRTNGTATSSSNGTAGRLLISPLAQRMAAEHGLDVASIDGSGPNGRVIKRDVLAAIKSGVGTKRDNASPQATGSSPQRFETVAQFEPGDQPLSNMRQTIAKRLVESKTSIPHYQVTFVFDMDPLLELRKTINSQLETQGIKLSVNDFLVRACALSIHQHPEFNAAWGGDHLSVKPDINVGVAIALPRENGGGLVVATLRNADRIGLRQISEETKALAQKARTRGLTIDEMGDSTFTISNLGMFGVEHFTAIINPPNAAILAVGAAIEKPVVRNGEIVIGHEMQATLSLDHRIIDGAMAAQYLQTLRQMIENPATLLV